MDLPGQLVSKWRKRFSWKRIGALEDRERLCEPSGFFPREVVVRVQALVYELSYEKWHSRVSVHLPRESDGGGAPGEIAAQISGTTAQCVGRMRTRSQQWQHRS
jgi:hypothetical protein